jgi:hypothetical protein
MFAPNPITFAYATESYSGNSAVAPGATVTMGFSNTPGTAVALIGTALTHDVELLEITVSVSTATALSGANTSAIIDILIDPAGGTSWDTTNILIEGLMVGHMDINGSGFLGSRRWNFPLWVPAGATIAAIGQTSVASGAADVIVKATAYGGVSDPSKYWCGTKVDAIGLTKASSKGTSVTPGTDPTWGSYTSIGSATTRRYGCLIPYANPNATTVSNVSMQMELGISSTKIGKTFNWNQSTTERSSDFIEDKRIFVDVPEGTQLQARMRGSTATVEQVIIHGVY